MKPCTLGMGCDEHGFCYALGMGSPEYCGRPPEEDLSDAPVEESIEE